jgi:hypothetical protein
MTDSGRERGGGDENVTPVEGVLFGGVEREALDWEGEPGVDAECDDDKEALLC